MLECALPSTQNLSHTPCRASPTTAPGVPWPSASPGTVARQNAVLPAPRAKEAEPTGHCWALALLRGGSESGGRPHPHRTWSEKTQYGGPPQLCTPPSTPTEAAAGQGQSHVHTCTHACAWTQHTCARAMCALPCTAPTHSLVCLCARSCVRAHLTCADGPHTSRAPTPGPTLSLGSRLMVLRGRRTRRTRRDLMVLMSFPLDPLEGEPHMQPADRTPRPSPRSPGRTPWGRGPRQGGPGRAGTGAASSEWTRARSAALGAGRGVRSPLMGGTCCPRHSCPQTSFCLSVRERGRRAGRSLQASDLHACPLCPLLQMTQTEEREGAGGHHRKQGSDPRGVGCG